MARSRNLKPGFFTNELLGAGDPLAQLLYAGLWCLADATNWQLLKEQVPVKVRKLAARFRDQKNPYQAAWAHINRKFFPGTRWQTVCTSPEKLPFAKLKEVHAYLDRCLKGNAL